MFVIGNIVDHELEREPVPALRGDIPAQRLSLQLHRAGGRRAHVGARLGADVAGRARQTRNRIRNS